MERTRENISVLNLEYRREEEREWGDRWRGRETGENMSLEECRNMEEGVEGIGSLQMHPTCNRGGKASIYFPNLQGSQSTPKVYIIYIYI